VINAAPTVRPSSKVRLTCGETLVIEPETAEADPTPTKLIAATTASAIVALSARFEFNVFSSYSHAKWRVSAEREYPLWPTPIIRGSISAGKPPFSR
jgi:hypothetical protein